MKFRNQFLKYKLHSNTDDGGAGGSGGQGGQSGSDGAGQNNQSDNLIVTDDFWNMDSQGDTNPDTNGQQSAGQTDTNSSGDSLSEYVSSLDFTSGVDFGKLNQGLQTGDAEALKETFSTFAQSIYKQALLDAHNLTTKKLEAAREEFSQVANETVEMKSLVREMNVQLPFTANPLHEPVAKAVLQQALKAKGATPEKALAAVKQYFEKLGSALPRENQPPRSRPGSSGFNPAVNGNGQNGAGTNTDTDEIDFFELLGGSKAES